MEVGPLGSIPATMAPPRSAVPASGFSDFIDGLMPAQGSSGEIAAPVPPSVAVGPAGPGPTREGLGPMLRPLGDFLGQVNSSLNEAGELQERLVAGEDVDFHDVMLASEKGAVALQLTMQLRNRILEAYQEIARMQV